MLHELITKFVLGSILLGANMGLLSRNLLPESLPFSSHAKALMLLASRPGIST